MDGIESQQVRVLGIDPGLNTTGYGVLQTDVNRLEIVEAGVIRSIRSQSLEQRLQSIYDGVVDVIKSFSPDVLAIEELYSHYERPTTAILMGHARGVLCLAAAQHGLPVCHYAATQIKRMLTGNGRASKPQVQLAVTRQLNLSTVPDPPDVADALAIAMCHHFLSRNPASSL